MTPDSALGGRREISRDNSEFIRNAEHNYRTIVFFPKSPLAVSFSSTLRASPRGGWETIEPGVVSREWSEPGHLPG